MNNANHTSCVATTQAVPAPGFVGGVVRWLGAALKAATACSLAPACCDHIKRTAVQLKGIDRGEKRRLSLTSNAFTTTFKAAAVLLLGLGAANFVYAAVAISQQVVNPSGGVALSGTDGVKFTIGSNGQVQANS